MTRIQSSSKFAAQFFDFTGHMTKVKRPTADQTAVLSPEMLKPVKPLSTAEVHVVPEYASAASA